MYGKQQVRVPARGFTLIELMIVVAIVAILAAIAYPSYREHVVKSRRATAQSCLLELAQFMERFYTTNMKYHETAGASPEGVELPSTTCTNDLDGHYSFAFADDEPTATTYKIEATPENAQAASDTLCGTLGIDQAGEKSEGGTATAVSECWK